MSDKDDSFAKRVCTLDKLQNKLLLCPERAGKKEDDKGISKLFEACDDQQLIKDEGVGGNSTNWNDVTSSELPAAGGRLPARALLGGQDKLANNNNWWMSHGGPWNDERNNKREMAQSILGHVLPAACNDNQLLHSDSQQQQQQQQQLVNGNTTSEVDQFHWLLSQVQPYLNTVCKGEHNDTTRPVGEEEEQDCCGQQVKIINKYSSHKTAVPQRTKSEPAGIDDKKGIVLSLQKPNIDISSSFTDKCSPQQLLLNISADLLKGLQLLEEEGAQCAAATSGVCDPPGSPPPPPPPPSAIASSASVLHEQTNKESAQYRLSTRTRMIRSKMRKVVEEKLREYCNSSSSSDEFD